MIYNQPLDSQVTLGGGRVGQEQLHGLLFGDKLSWQAIIYDLINAEQLDPWDVDIGVLSRKYLSRVRELEEDSFFVSSKVLLAASLLLRMKSEILLNRDLPSLDDILFGREEEARRYEQERIVLDEEIPGLIPRTPLPRGRRVTLQELMGALSKAIKTENRRIKRVVVDKLREREAQTVMPRRGVDLKDQIAILYGRIQDHFSADKSAKREAFSHFAGVSDKEKIENFLPLLHLDHQHKIFAEQESTFDEIWIWLKDRYVSENASVLDRARQEVIDHLKESGGVDDSDNEVDDSDNEVDDSDNEVDDSDNEVDDSDNEVDDSDKEINVSDKEINVSDKEINVSDKEINVSDKEINVSDKEINDFEEDDLESDKVSPDIISTN